MNIKVCLMGFFLLLSFSVFGDEKTDLAKELMALTNMGQMTDEVKSQVQQMQNRMLAQYDIPEDKKEKVAEFQKKVSDKIFEIMDFGSMESEYLELFTSVYTVEELMGIIAFYKSPVGKSMVEKQPMILSKAIEISQSKLKVLIPEIQKMSEEFEQELEKH